MLFLLSKKVKNSYFQFLLSKKSVNKKVYFVLFKKFFKLLLLFNFRLKLDIA